MGGRLAGRVAVITGGASGLGAAMAGRFVEEGASVVLGDIQDEQGSAVAAALGSAASYRHCDVLVEADVSAIGMPGKRGEAVRALTRGVLYGAITLDESAEPADLTAVLTALPGIGPWTAGYVGMRVARDPDAFPDADWVVLKVLGMTASAARKRAEAWRPWRSYAVMTLWRMEGERRENAA